MLARLVRSNKLLHLGKICFFSTGSAFAQRLENWNRLFPSYTAAESGGLEKPASQPSALGKKRCNISNWIENQLCYCNGVLCDVDSTHPDNAIIETLKTPTSDDAMFSVSRENKDFFRTMWHSSTHLLAYALEMYYGDKVKLIHGPSGEGVPYCFFYEVALDGEAPTDNDLKAIQRIINKLLKKEMVFEHHSISKEEAHTLFAENPYKLHIIEHATDPISVYKCGDFIDLCRGPHIHSTSAISILTLISANFVESKDSKPHYRFYGNSFISPSASGFYKKIMKEAKDRDHRLIGKKLDLFLFDGNSPGNVFFLDRGLFIYNQLIRHMKDRYLTEYEEISSPLLFKSDLWKTSGHYDHYRNNMFQVNTRNTEEEIYLKPMNCPSHCLIFNSKSRSYRDLPLRYAEFSPIHRQENSGALGGLTRLNMFHQDDGHIFCRMNQIGSEIGRLLDIIRELYGSLGFKYSFVVSTQPADSVGASTDWKKTESQLRSILEAKNLSYSVEEGDGAFYAPKIDVLIQDSLCRYHQCGTIQLDVQLPTKFNLKYKNENAENETPVLIHRAVYGSLERFLGVFIEHCNGRFSLFFSPYQVALLPVSDDSHVQYCNEIVATLRNHFKKDLRIDVLSPELSLSKRIRECTMKHYNYMITVGNAEVEKNVLSVRSRGEKDSVSLSLNQFSDRIEKELSLFS